MKVISERLSGEALKAQIDHFGRMKSALFVLDAIPDAVLIVNTFRQAVYANRAFLELIPTDAKHFLGMRLGEIIQCEHSSKNPAGCGLSENCSVCGALNCMIKTMQNGEMCSDEYRVTNRMLDAFEYEVSTSPYITDIGEFVFISLKDISESKRKAMLERMFLHDLMNSVSGVRGLLELITSGETENDFSDILLNMTDNVIDEIKTYQLLSCNGNNLADVEFETIISTEVLDSLTPFFQNSDESFRKELKTVHIGPAFEFQSEKALLNRVLINLVKNAFEASDDQMIVAASVRKDGADALLEVHNNTYIERDVQLQIFQRSFSTKGKGRGTGTYSVRLITEKYLNGSVTFESVPDSGTTFTVRLPIHPH